jgi:hypothetical protein
LSVADELATFVAALVVTTGVGVAVAVGVGVGVGVAVAVGVDVAVGVAVGVGVGVKVAVAVGLEVGVAVGLCAGVAVAVAVGVGVGPDCAQYLPPLFQPPPQTIISLPVHTAVCVYRGSGTFVRLVVVQLSVPGLYLPPVLNGT